MSEYLAKVKIKELEEPIVFILTELEESKYCDAVIGERTDAIARLTRMPTRLFHNKVERYKIDEVLIYGRQQGGRAVPFWWVVNCKRYRPPNARTRPEHDRECTLLTEILAREDAVTEAYGLNEVHNLWMRGAVGSTQKLGELQHRLSKLLDVETGSVTYIVYKRYVKGEAKGTISP